MDELLYSLAIFAFVLLVWAALGHGLWLVGAFFLRLIFSTPPAIQATQCQTCGQRVIFSEGRCPNCGAGAEASSALSLAGEIQGTLKQLDRLWRRGLITDEERTRLRAACQRDLDRMWGPVPAVSPAVATPVARTPSVAADHEIAIAELAPASDIIEAEIVEPAVLASTAAPPEVANTVHPLDKPEPAPLAPVGPPQARRALADVLSAFMQERNIRWGEVVSGLLIVGSAAGLVLSLRDQLLEWIPYFPAFLFLLGTAAIHGAGLYTLRRWNLQSTSRGVLTITLLLVPLNFLAAILISNDDAERLPVTSPTYLAAITIGMLAFGAICYTGARALVARRWPALALAVLGPSTVQLAINRLLTEENALLSALWLSSAAAGCFIAGVMLLIWAGRHWHRVSLTRAQPLLLTLGLGGFAVVLPLSLIIARSGPWGPTLSHLAPVIALLGATIVTAGLFLVKRTFARSLALLAVTGTSLAILGGALMLIAVAFAWPAPERLILVGGLCAVVLSVQAFAGGLPLLHLPAVACATLALLIGFHRWQGSLADYEANDYGLQILRTWWMGRSALLLSGLAVATSLYAGLWAWLRQREHALYLLASAAGLALVSLAIAVVVGFVGGPDHDLCTAIFAGYTGALVVAAVIVARRIESPQRSRAERRIATILPVSAACLGWMTVVHAVGFNDVVREGLQSHERLPERPVLLATIAVAVIVTSIALVVATVARGRKLRRQVAEPLALTGWVISLSALWFAVLVQQQRFAVHSGYVLVIGFVWLAVALLQRSPRLWTAGQLVVSLAIAYGAIAVSQQQTWWSELPLDPRAIAIVITALAGWGAISSIARRCSERWPGVQATIAPPWPSADHTILAVLVGVLAIGTGYCVWLGVGQELRFAAELTAGQQRLLAAQQHPLLWLALGTIVVALFAAAWERLEWWWGAALLLVLAVPCGWAALQFLDSVAVASALRWSLAAYLIVTTLVICVRQQLAQLGRALPLTWRGTLGPHRVPMMIVMVLGLGAAPIVILTVVACVDAAQGFTPRGPLPGSFFADFGWTISYVAPLIVVVLSLVCLSLRERQPTLMLAGSGVFQLGLSLGCIMPVLTSGGALDGSVVVQLCQWNAIGLGIYSLLWLAVQPWLGSALSFLQVQLAMLIGATLGLVAWASGAIVLDEPRPWLGDLISPLGTWPSFAALAVAALAIGIYLRQSAERWWGQGLGAVAVALVPLLAAAAHVYEPHWPWISYHVLLTGWLLIAGALATLACYDRDRSFAVRGASVLLSVVVALNLINGWSDPIAWWPTLLNLASLAFVVALGTYRRQQGFAYASVVLSIMTATQWWLEYWPQTATHWFDGIAVNLLAVIVLCGWWLAVEIYRERVRAGELVFQGLLPVPMTLTPVLTAVQAGFVGLLVLSRMVSQTQVLVPVNLLAVAALGSYLLAQLWYDRQRMALACLYVWGLASACLLAEPLLPWRELADARLPTIVAAYVMFTGIVWYSGAWLAAWGQRLGVHEPISALERFSRWLPLVTLLVAGGVVSVNTGLVLMHNVALVRYVAGFGPVLLALGIAMQAQQQRRLRMLYLSLLTATAAAILLAWAELPAGEPALGWLRRSIRVLVVLGSLGLLFHMVLPRLLSHLADWPAVLRRMAQTCVAGAGLALVAILLLETWQFMVGRPAPLSHGEVGVVAVVLGLLAATLISMAVAPSKRHDATSETLRMAYVYAAQVVLALAFGHMYLTRPEWFDSLLRPYWPYIVMAIAFVGVGLSEWLQRYKLRVLSEPLSRTGVFLPLLPALGWWVEASRGEPTTDYDMVMFVVGLLYVVVSVCRQSALSAAAAGVAGNIALWALMADRGWNFAAHPQFWLIPPALSVLVGTQLNRHRLSTEQLTAIRYVCILVVYLSSTSEIFITGVTSIWPPLILAALAVCGVLAGMALQIRAFLYLGTSFVFLSMVTMVWHASKTFGQVWPWWAFGICVGLAMLVFFGLFEKKRAEITVLVEKLRQWQH